MLPESDLDWILLESVCMADAFGESTRQSKLHAIFRVFGEGELVLALRSILEPWVLPEQLRNRIGTHGMYETLDYPPHSISRYDGQCSDDHLARGNPVLARQRGSPSTITPAWVTARVGFRGHRASLFAIGPVHTSASIQGAARRMTPAGAGRPRWRKRNAC